MALVFGRYVGVLGAGGAADGTPERLAYDNLRARLSDGGSPTLIYGRLLTAFLNGVDRFFGDHDKAHLGVFRHAFWLRGSYPLWTGAALDRCLLLALDFLSHGTSAGRASRSSYAKQSCVQDELCDPLTSWHRSQIRRRGPSPKRAASGYRKALNASVRVLSDWGCGSQAVPLASCLMSRPWITRFSSRSARGRRMMGFRRASSPVRLRAINHCDGAGATGATRPRDPCRPCRPASITPAHKPRHSRT